MASAGQSAGLSVPGGLNGVAAESSGNAWAVGSTASSTENDQPILAHWNGTAWKTVSSTALPSRGALFGAATFPGGAWAVGQAGVLVHGGVPRHLLVRMTCTTVRRVQVPGRADGTLWAVTATSASNAWAVGFFSRRFSGGRETPLILHWNGRAWKIAPLPATVGQGAFTGVAATSRTNAWAVMNAGRLPRIAHWNGRRWGQVVTPHIGMSYRLLGVAATSASNAWAVGFTGSSRTVILHWNGRTWMRVPSPNPSHSQLGSDYLTAVAASSATNAWAVGVTAEASLTLHWNGHSWKQVATPTGHGLVGVCFIPPTRQAWAVGATSSGTGHATSLILRWNGSTWH